MKGSQGCFDKNGYLWVKVIYCMFIYMYYSLYICIVLFQLNGHHTGNLNTRDSTHAYMSLH